MKTIDEFIKNKELLESEINQFLSDKFSQFHAINGISPSDLQLNTSSTHMVGDRYPVNHVVKVACLFELES